MSTNNMSSQRVLGGNTTIFDSRKLNSAACEEEILRELHDLCRSHRARIIVVLIEPTLLLHILYILYIHTYIQHKPTYMYIDQYIFLYNSTHIYACRHTYSMHTYISIHKYIHTYIYTGRGCAWLRGRGARSASEGGVHARRPGAFPGRSRRQGPQV